MPLKLQITSEHREMLGSDATREFRGTGGTIGRALENDWILADPDRFISGRHATIDFRGGAWYLADISTNGVYINDDEEPLGRGKARRLFDGDRLRMGDFQFEVNIDEGEELDMPAPSKSFMPEHLALMVDEEPNRTGIQLLDEEEITGDEAFRSTLFGSTARSTQKMERKPAARPIARPAEPAPRKPKRASATPITRARDGDPSAEQLFQIFLDGMGVDRADLHPSTDLAQVMQNAGEVLREFVAGMTTLLISRSNFKSLFKLDQTTILPQRNNPLKVSESTEDSLKQLLVGREGEYLGPPGSVREACRDLKFHHDAMVEAMVDTFVDFVDRFEPSELKEGFDRSLAKKPLIDALNRLRYWQLYCDFHATVSAAGEGPLPEQFGEEFVRAYEKQIADFKRLDRDDSEAA